MPTMPRTALFMLLAACGPQLPMTTEGDGSSGSTTSGPPTPTPTTAVDPSTGNSAATTDDFTFILSPDGGGCVAAVNGEYDVRCTECNPWVQDCPDGHKCVPFADDGGDVWHALTCVPLDPEPDHAGEPCTVDPESYKLIDSCDLESICLGADPDTGERICVPLCKGTPDAPECPEGSACVIGNEGVLIPCLPTCNPLETTCPVDQVCMPNFSDSGFVCLGVDVSSLGQLFEPCDQGFGCAGGLSCENPAHAVECDPGQEGCCLPYCDLGMPACPGAMQECQPFFGMDEAPPGLANLGVCRLP